MKPKELTDFENSTNSIGYAKKYHLKMDNSDVIVEYDCESCKFIVMRSYEFFKGNSYTTGNHVTAKNYVFILTHVKNNEDAEHLLWLCGMNSGVELCYLKPQIALHKGLKLTSAQYLLFGITPEYIELQRTGAKFCL
jgi:hypothetical protein